MKKGKVFGKSQIAVTVMLLALAAAVWLNMKYSSASTKYLGEATYVSKSSSESPTVQTKAAAKEEDSDYFEMSVKERDQAKTKIEETVQETLKSDKLTDDDKKAAVDKVKEIADRIEKENNIETLLKAKGFEKTVVVISDDGISVVVKSNGLTTAQTLQIQDIVMAQSKIDLSAITIVPVK